MILYHVIIRFSFVSGNLPCAASLGRLKEMTMDRGEILNKEERFGGLPHVPHSSWRHELPDEDIEPSERIDADEFWERLGL